MKKKILIFLILMLLPFMVNAEKLKIDWQKSMGGDAKDQYYDMVELADGSLVLVGTTRSSELDGVPLLKYDYDGIIEKRDKDGNLLWRTFYSGNDYDTFAYVTATPDGGFIVTGMTESTDIEGFPLKGKDDAIIVKYDKDGKLLWQHVVGGTEMEHFRRATIVENDNILVMTNTASSIEGLTYTGVQDIIFIKYDQNGNELWRHNYGGNDLDYCNEYFVTSDYSIICQGYTKSTNIPGYTWKGNSDEYFFKIDKDGKLLWQKGWGGNSLEQILDVKLTEDEGLIAIGNSSSTDIEGLPNNGESDSFILRYDTNGNLLWQKSFGGNGRDWLEGIIETEDNCYVSYGFTTSSDIEGVPNNGEFQAIFIKYDDEGKIVWHKGWGGTNDDSFEVMTQTSDGGFVAYVETYSTDLGLPTDTEESGDVVIVKFDKDGKELWKDCIVGTLWEQIDGIVETRDQGVLAYGSTNSIDIEGITVNNYEWNDEVIIVKYSKTGQRLWISSWGGDGSDLFKYLITSKDNNLIAYAEIDSDEFPGLETHGSDDGAVVKLSFDYEIKFNKTTGDTPTAEKKENYMVVINPSPNKGYMVDKIIVKDIYDEEVELIKNEDGTYTFEIFSDVIVDITYADYIENPKTGMLDFITIIIVGFLMSITGFFIVKTYNEKLEI